MLKKIAWTTHLIRVLITLFSPAIIYLTIKNVDSFSWPSLVILTILFTIAIITKKQTTKITLSKAEKYLGLIATFLIIFIFSLSYWDSVPIGYSGESMQYVEFAKKIQKENFTYMPYAWYSHTILSYFIAINSFLFESDITATRFTNIFFNCITLFTFFIITYKIYGLRVAWISTILFASSPWFTYLSRDGYTHYLMPFFQIIFCYSLFKAHTTGKGLWFIATSFSVALCLHVYWGLYLIPIVWVLFYFYSIYKTKHDRYKIAFLSIFSIIFSVILMLPFIKFIFTKNKYFYKWVLDHLITHNRHSKNLLYSLNKNATKLFSQLLDLNSDKLLFSELILVFAVLGVLISIKKSSKNSYSAILLITLVIFILGPLITKTNSWELAGTILPIFTFAGIALATYLHSIRQFSYNILYQFFLLFTLIIIGHEVTINYQESFNNKDRLLSYHAHPKNSYGKAFMIMNAVKNDKNTFLLSTSNNEASIKSLIKHAKNKITDFLFTNNLKYIHQNQVFFSKELVPKKGNLEIIFSPSKNKTSSTDNLLLKKIKSIYPSTTIQGIKVPSPYYKLINEPPLSLITIQRKELLERQGLIEISESDSYYSYGKLIIENSSKYKFRNICKSNIEMQILGRSIEFNSTLNKNSELLLEKGLAPVSFNKEKSKIKNCIEFKNHKKWENLNSYIVNFHGLEKFQIEPYLSSIGKYSNFNYKLIKTFENLNGLSNKYIEDAAYLKEDTLLITSNGVLHIYKPSNNHITKLKLLGRKPHLLDIDEEQVTIVSLDGKLSLYNDGKLKSWPKKICKIKDLATLNTDENILLCFDNSILLVKKNSNDFQIDEILGPTVERNFTSIIINNKKSMAIVLDEKNSEAIYFTILDKKIERIDYLDKTTKNSLLQLDEKGYLYLKTHLRSIYTTSEGETQLFERNSNKQNLFIQSKKNRTSLFDPKNLNKVKFNFPYATSISHNKRKLFLFMHQEL